MDGDAAAAHLKDGLPNRLQVRRKGSVKCTLKTKASPHGTLASKKKMELKSQQLKMVGPSGPELQELLAGLKLRRIEQRTDGESVSSPEVQDADNEACNARLHTPATWKEKFSLQASSGCSSMKPPNPPPKPIGNNIAKATVKPVITAKKPIGSVLQKTAMFSGAKTDNKDQNGSKIKPAPAPKGPLVEIQNGGLKPKPTIATDKKGPLPAKPQTNHTKSESLLIKPKHNIDNSTENPQGKSLNNNKESLVSLALPKSEASGKCGDGSTSSGPTPVSPSRAKTSALKAMFETSLNEAKIATASGIKSPSRSPKVLRKFPITNANVETTKNISSSIPESSAQNRGEPMDSPTDQPKPSRSSRSSDSSAYDDVLVGAESGCSDCEADYTGNNKMRIRLPKDVMELDSGRGSTVSTDDTSATGTTEGDNPWSEWIDETPDEKPEPGQKPTLPRRSRHSSITNRHSAADAHPKRSRRGTAPKTRFWSNPERTTSVKSHASSDYDDVVLPCREGENEWETESETSEMDSTSQLSESSTSLTDVRRSLTDPGIFHIEDLMDGGNIKPLPVAPPRGISPPKPLLPRLHDHNAQRAGSPRRDSPQGGSPRESPRASPVPRIIASNDHRPSVAKSIRRPRRKVSLDSSIPPPCGIISRNRPGSGHSDCSGGSIAENPEAGESSGMPPKLPPRNPGDYPALPARRPANKEEEPPPPLPPRDPDIFKDSGSSSSSSSVPQAEVTPPPKPPRQKPRTSDLAPNTIVPLSPEAKEAARKERERDEHRGKPRLPPPRKKAATVTTTAQSAPSVLSSSPRKGEPILLDANSQMHVVPPPPPSRLKSRPAGDDYVGPDPSPSSLQPPLAARDVYLAMDNMGKQNRPASLRHGSDSTDGDNYIDPRDIESWPGQQKPADSHMPEPFSDLWKRDDSDDENYLTVLPEHSDVSSQETDTIGRSTINRFGDEPLYQIYHFGAVARDVLDQHRDDENLDEDEDTYSALDNGSDIESPAKMYETWEELTMSRTRKSAAEIKSTLQTVIRSSTGVRTLWCEMPEVRESGILSQMSVEDKRFQETLFELITSEASYLKSLKLLITHFMQSPELTPDIISKRDKHILFSNIVAVHNVSEEFMNEMERVWQEDFMLRPALCTLITKYASGDFQVYVTYNSNADYQQRKLRRLKETNQGFLEVLYKLERSSQCHGLPLQSFLTMPMQRITRLPLLIDAVCKRMPLNHEEYDLVSTALHTFQKLVRQSNEGARQMQSLEEMAAIDKSLIFKNLKKMAIVSQGRYLVKKGPLTHLRKDASGIFIKKKKEQLYLFLFNDILIITKKKGEDMYSVLDYAARINCHAEAVQPDQLARAIPHGAPGNASNVFVMALLENHDKKPADFYFTCDTPSEQLRWVEAVAPAQQVNDDERIYEAWACPQVQTIYRYVAAEPDELSLEEADVVNVLRKMADGWYEGERIRDGEKGWFPANHTVEIQNERVRARNLLQRYRLLTLHTQSPGSATVTAAGQAGTVHLEASLVSSV